MYIPHFSQKFSSLPPPPPPSNPLTFSPFRLGLDIKLRISYGWQVQLGKEKYALLALIFKIKSITKNAT